MSDEKNLNIKIIPPKEYLPYVFSALVAVIIIFLAILSFNALKESKFIGRGVEFRNTITISGQGRIFAKPDIGQVDLSVVTEAATVVKAVRESNEKMNKINKAMQELGIKEDDLKTTAYNINPRYQYLAGKSSIIGYEVNQTLQVKIRDLDKTSPILEKAAELGANQVGSLNFTFDDPEKIKEEARQKAIANAKKKAELMASNLNVSLGKVVGFDESSDGDPVPFYRTDIGGIGGGGALPAPEIQTGQNEIVVNVNLVYEID